MAFSTGRRSFTTFVSRALSHKSSPSFSPVPRTRSALSALAQQPQSRPSMLVPNSVSLPTRSMSSGGHSSLNDPSPNWTNRPPKETILLDGCDYEHWLVVLEFPDPKPSRDEMIDAYVKILAKVVGSEEEAKKRIYSVSTTTYTGFGCRISEELSYKFKEFPEALWVLPDSYLDVPNKDYGGDLYVDGVVTRRPQYDFSDRQETNKRKNKPNHDRRREPMRVERRAPPQQKKPQATSKEPENSSQAEAGGSTEI